MASLPYVDYVLRGDTAEHTLEKLAEHILDETVPVDVPNLTWVDGSGNLQVNPTSYVPDRYDHLTLNYHPMVKSVVRERGFAELRPFFSLDGISHYGCVEC